MGTLLLLGIQYRIFKKQYKKPYKNSLYEEDRSIILKPGNDRNVGYDLNR
jgi:hypothetical protein